MLLATFRLEPEAVALADTLAELPCLKVEAERVAAHNTQWTMPCLWLQHYHLPVLAEAGVVQYDARSGYARYYEDSLLEAYLERC